MFFGPARNVACSSQQLHCSSFFSNKQKNKNKNSLDWNVFSSSKGIFLFLIFLLTSTWIRLMIPDTSSSLLLNELLTHSTLSTHTKQSFFPPSSSASFQECLRPYGSTENECNRCSSYFRPIGGAWNSPKTEKKTRSMHIKLARCKQTDSRRRNPTQQKEDENGLCKETRIVSVDR